MITVSKVENKKDVKEFIEFPLRLYKGNEYFVPPLYADEKALFKKNTVYDEQAESIFFLAKENGKTVGRIHGILQRVSNQKWNQKRVRFTRFDSIDSQEVADALFEAVENWAIEKGMDTVVGPLGFSDLEREGLLVEGFDQLSTFEEQYNYDYYQKLIENRGYQKEVDWTERKLYAPKNFDERIARISSRMMEKYELKFGEAKNTADFIKKYGDKLFDVLDKTYVDIYQSVPFTEKMKKSLISGFKLIVNVENVAVILDKNDNVVCFGVCFPSIAKAVQKSGGKLTPLAILRLLKAIKNPKVIDLALIGVLPEYRGKAIASALINEIHNMLKKDGVEYAETNLNLEDNLNIQNQWKVFDSVQHKRRRSFVKKLR
ncbi:MAG: GNAT family N-acetyltransferase [Clostridiales bacterium]|nr:GNAT family N-acetyltransferase [Clostridiales bacterium]